MEALPPAPVAIESSDEECGDLKPEEKDCMTHSKSKKKVQDPADLGLNIGALRLQSHAEAGNMEGNPFSICFSFSGPRLLQLWSIDR